MDFYKQTNKRFIYANSIHHPFLLCFFCYTPYDHASTTYLPSFLMQFSMSIASSSLFL